MIGSVCRIFVGAKSGRRFHLNNQGWFGWEWDENEEAFSPSSPRTSHLPAWLNMSLVHNSNDAAGGW